MVQVSTSTLSDALRWRYATQKFDTQRKIAPEVWSALEQALVLTPSSCGLQPWKFIVVRDPATLEKLSAASWGQTQPVEASHFVVFAARENYGAEDLEHLIERTAEVRGASRESLDGYARSISGAIEGKRSAGTLDEWMTRQIYIALGQFMTSAALLGVDTCPMEGLQPEKFDEILGLGALGYATRCAAAAGYRAADDKYARLPKVRFKPGDVILHV